MNGARDQLLSGTRFAEDADGHVAPGDAGDQSVDLANGGRLTDDPFDRVARRSSRIFVQEPAQPVMLGAHPKQCSNGVAGVRGPTRQVFDVQQLTLAASHPVGGGGGEDRIELRRWKRSERSDLLPLTEAVAGRVAPVGRGKGGFRERKRKSGRGAENAQFGLRGTLPGSIRNDAQLGGDSLRHVHSSAAERRAEEHQLFGYIRCGRRDATAYLPFEKPSGPITQRDVSEAASRSKERVATGQLHVCCGPRRAKRRIAVL